MEATAAGLPVITTDVAALGEAVDEGESGLLVPPARWARACARRWRRWSTMLTLRERMGRAGARAGPPEVRRRVATTGPARSHREIAERDRARGGSHDRPEFSRRSSATSCCCCCRQLLIPLIVGPIALVTAPVFYETLRRRVGRSSQPISNANERLEQLPVAGSEPEQSTERAAAHARRSWSTSRRARRWRRWSATSAASSACASMLNG